MAGISHSLCVSLVHPRVLSFEFIVLSQNESKPHSSKPYRIQQVMPVFGALEIPVKTSARQADSEFYQCYEGNSEALSSSVHS